MQQMELNSVSRMLSKGQVAVQVQLSKLGSAKKFVFCLWANRGCPVETQGLLRQVCGDDAVCHYQTVSAPVGRDLDAARVEVLTLENREQQEIYTLHWSCLSEVHIAQSRSSCSNVRRNRLAGSLRKHLVGCRFQNSEQVEMALGCTWVRMQETNLYTHITFKYMLGWGRCINRHDTSSSIAELD